MWKAFSNLNKWLAKRLCPDWEHIFYQNCAGNDVINVELAVVPLDFSYFLESEVSSYFENDLIQGFECEYKLGDVEGFNLGGGVGSDSCACTLGGCATGYTLVGGAGVLVIFGNRRFLF